MAVQLMLKDKATNEFKLGRDFIEIDENMCRDLEEECSDEHFLHAWVDTIGFSLALGKSFEDARAQWSDNEMLQRIGNWLEERYENASYSTAY